MALVKPGPVWGIDVGDHALKAVKLRRTGEQIALLDYRIIRYSDVAGDPAARREGNMLQALAELQTAGLGRDRCYVSIAPQSVFSRFISLPPVDRRRVPEIVLYEARQQIPFSLSEVIWTYETVRKEFIPGEEIEIGLFAVKREVMDAYLAELAPLARQLEGVQMAPLALYNFVRHEVPVGQAAVVIDVGAQSTDLIIIDGPKFWLRNLPIAGNSFTAVLERRLNLPAAEAEKLKCVVAESRHRKKLLEVLRPTMRELVAEIQRSIGYYKSLSQDVKFEDVFVMGEGYRLFGLDRFLAEQLQYRITPVRQFQKIAYQGPPDRAGGLNDALGSLGVATGLALQGLGRGLVTTNLLPDDFVIRRELHRKRFSGVIAAVLLWAVVGCFYLKEKSALSSVARLKGQGETTLAQVQKLRKELAAARRPADPKKYELIQTFGKYREYYGRIIDALARVKPDGIRIDQFTISEGTVSAEQFGARFPGGRPGGPMGPMPGGGARRRRPGVGPPGGGAPGAGPGAPAPGGRATSGIVVSFTAVCDARKEARELEERLPAELKKAAVYPERVKIVKQVFVGQVTRQVPARGTRDGRLGQMELTAPVTVVLRRPEEVEKERQRLRAQRAARKTGARPGPASGSPRPAAGRPTPAQVGTPSGPQTR